MAELRRLTAPKARKRPYQVLFEGQPLGNRVEHSPAPDQFDKFTGWGVAGLDGLDASKFSGYRPLRDSR